MVAFQGPKLGRLPGRTPCCRPSVGARPGRLAETLGSGDSPPPLPPAATEALVSSGSAAWPTDPAVPVGRVCSAGCLLPLPPAPCWQSRGRTAGAWGRSPRAAGRAQLLATSKMTICHSIKVSGQLMGEPGSATPGQNGLLPRIGEVQMLNAEHCALSQPWPPPGRRSGRWTAAG